MQYFKAMQRTDGKWDYTVTWDKDTRPVGYCHTWREWAENDQKMSPDQYATALANQHKYHNREEIAKLYEVGESVITPPAKAGGFLRRSPLQQRLLRLRMTHPSTLTSEGPIQAHCHVLKVFQVLRGRLPATAGNLKLLRCADREDDTEAMILLIPPKSNRKVYLKKEAGANFPVAQRRQSPRVNCL